jgi:small subunit ribosomal protein S8
MMTDPIADMLTRIRNANAIGRKQADMPASRLKVGIAEVLKEEGFIDGFAVEPAQPVSVLSIQLRYGPDGEQVIRAIERISKPGRRVYMSATEIPPVLRGLGSYVLSTNKGVVSDRTARKINAGGEVLLKVS